MPFYFLFSLYRLSGVPSFFVCTVAGAALAASLFDLYRISAVPSFFVGPAVAELAAVRLSRFWMPLQAVAVFGVLWLMQVS